jgi:hypothetical protein
MNSDFQIDIATGYYIVVKVRGCSPFMEFAALYNSGIGYYSEELSRVYFKDVPTDRTSNRILFDQDNRVVATRLYDGYVNYITKKGIKTLLESGMREDEILSMTAFAPEVVTKIAAEFAAKKEAEKNIRKYHYESGNYKGLTEVWDITDPKSCLRAFVNLCRRDIRFSDLMSLDFGELDTDAALDELGY